MREEPGLSLEELMLAKTVLEESNEALDREAERLRALEARSRELRARIEELRSLPARPPAAGSMPSGEGPEAERASYEEGVFEALGRIADVLADFDAWCELTRLVGGLLERLGRRYGVERIGLGGDGRIDPACHRVIEVRSGSRAAVELLAHGYRVGRRILRPALVRVIRPSGQPRAEGSVEDGGAGANGASDRESAAIDARSRARSEETA